ncbi:MAG: cytochrome c biogenesis protein CcsA, partial [Gammaproteobacteria bacterium]|nr:cytochrome c biogenesis protein CcsA [Gammaproteobacteria bacterium]
GWWFWDPVENASFMPWLAGAALIHSLAITEKRGLFKSWTVLLAIMTFSLSLLGTFLVRSGILVSVHAFASDPARGLYILAFLCTVVGGALALYAWRAPALKSDAAFELGSREAMILVNNALLVATTGLILIGTLYPLFMDAMGLGKISVGPPYFNAVFVIPTLPLVILLAVGMHSSWKRTRFTQVKIPLAVLLAISLAISLLLTTVVYDTFSFTALVGFTAAFWVIGSSIFEPLERWRRGVAIGGSVIGMAIAHLGVGLFTLGVTGVQTYKIEKDISLGVGESSMLSGYEFKFMGIKEVRGPNYDAQEGEILILRDGNEITTLKPQKRYYRSGGNPMTEAGIRVGPHRDLFVALGEDLGQGKWSMRVQYKPLIRWIWIGAFIIAIGGLAAALDRRYRVPAKASDLEPAAGAARGEA